MLASLSAFPGGGRSVDPPFLDQEFLRWNPGVDFYERSVDNTRTAKPGQRFRLAMLRSPTWQKLAKHRYRQVVNWKCAANRSPFCQYRRGFRHLHQHRLPAIRRPPGGEADRGQLSSAPAQRLLHCHLADREPPAKAE